uniref:RanBP-type and C3HC4-type zinc finger-containing protein 1 n=1 Tax=Schizaphis graminum TaxID=13262 RepID=A0A2S2P874_SCHGA
MPGTLSYNRRRVDGGGAAAQLPCRYYATERRRHRYSSFSIMKWFRRSKHYGDSGDDDDDSAWFRDDLQRIRQAYVEQEPDYAAVTPVAVRRRPAAAATWSRWSGSTTTVYSFAYVDGPPRNDDEKGVATGRDDDDDDDKDAVEYIDAATLPAAHRRRTDRGQPNSSSTAAGTSARAGHQASTTGTMTATRRRNKRVAPPPPLATVQESHAVAAAVQGMSANTATVQRRVAGTMSRKKYRAPLPPANASELKPPSPQQQQQQRGPCRRAAPAQRRRKGPAPKPPVVQRPQPQPVVTAVAAAAATGSNVKRKISQYERDRLMQRVDKIEKHFFDKKPPTTSETTAAAGRGHGFASPAALYTAMAATNLTELDKRAAEICRQRNQRGGLGVPLTVPLTADHKNAIVAAVIRKSYPTATATAAAVAADDDGKRSDKVSGPSAADDEKRLVRHKRLAFFQQQRPTGLADKWSTVGKDTATASGATAVPEPSLQTKPTAFEATAAAKTSEVDATPSVVRSDGGGSGGCSSAADTKNLPSEDKDINCYQQLMDMEMQSDLVLHNGSFECAVCLCTYDNNGVVLRDCLHVFCRLCLKMTIDHSKAEQVECPYIDERYSCTGVLQHREIKKILNSDEEYERFLQRSVERARQLLAKEHNGGSFQCSRPDCTGWCLIYDKNNVLEFKCPVCGTVTCVRCGSIHTQGRGCKKLIEENEGDGTLENLIERGDAMLCPGCNTVLSKQQGCDWIKCAVCFMEICWATKGPRWGPKGKGDTTAGCKCGIPPGRKCHIDCKYCH